MRSLAAHWFREMSAVARQGALLTRTLENVVVPPVPETNVSSMKGPLVVFVHGYFAHGGVMLPLAEHLEREGIAPRQAHLSYGLAGTVASLARRLDALVRAQNPNDDPVYIVGHSMGGLVARYYAQVLLRPLARLVCLATPHRGTTRAGYFTALPLAGELAPGSETLALLERTRDRLSDTRVLSIVAGRDTMVVPTQNAALDGHEVVELEELGHQGILFDRGAWAHVERFVREPR